MKRLRAFTLVELLVVIAIIAILAAVLFPVFVRAKASAKSTACMSNLRQLAIGVALYQGDSDDVYPLGAWDYPGHPAETLAASRWYFDIAPYTGNKTQLRVSHAGVFSMPPSGYGADYGINESISFWKGALGSNVIRKPSETLLLANAAQYDADRLGGSRRDRTYPRRWGPYAVGMTDWQVTGPYIFGAVEVYPYAQIVTGYEENFRRPFAAHNGRVNITFADGHGASVLIEALIGKMPYGHVLGDPKNYWDNED
ncbi:MAG: prepilin-type N-terminal cleavage/methylation domain-containing protein [Fimbriimonas sp.]